MTTETPTTPAPPAFWFTSVQPWSGETIVGSGDPTGRKRSCLLNPQQPSPVGEATVNGDRPYRPTPVPICFGTAFPIRRTVPAPPVPGNVVPFQGDFDGDGLRSGYYISAPRPGTWTIEAGLVSFPLGTANSSIPVVGYFDANLPEEAAVYTVVNGQGTWSINTGITGVHTVPLRSGW